MHFAATLKSSDEDSGQEILLATNGNGEFDESRYTDQYLETPLTSDGLQKRLLRLALNAKTAEEEQGVEGLEFFSKRVAGRLHGGEVLLDDFEMYEIFDYRWDLRLAIEGEKELVSEEDFMVAVMNNGE